MNILGTLCIFRHISALTHGEGAGADGRQEIVVEELDDDRCGHIVDKVELIGAIRQLGGGSCDLLENSFFRLMNFRTLEGDVDFGEQHLLAICNHELLIGLFLANLRHFLPSSVMYFLLDDQAVSLSLIQNSFMLDA